MKEQPFDLKQFADIQITGVAQTKGSERLLAQAVQSIIITTIGKIKLFLWITIHPGIV